MKAVVVVLGAIAVLLGGLWALQGLGIVTIPPILCFAECEAIEGGSPAWVAIGLVTLAVGGLMLFFALRRTWGPRGLD